MTARWLSAMRRGLAVMVAGRRHIGSLWRSRAGRSGRPIRPIPGSVILLGALAVGLVTYAATAWLVHHGALPVNNNVERAKLGIEAIRTGLLVGAGTGAALALMLAGRRQWLAERTHQVTEFDATQRRGTDLYVKAADQLGSDKAPVRLAGLYAMERLAQNNPNQRRPIVNVICAYLRMPYTPPRDQPPHRGARRHGVVPGQSRRPEAKPAVERAAAPAAELQNRRSLRPRSHSRDHWRARSMRVGRRAVTAPITHKR